MPRLTAKPWVIHSTTIAGYEISILRSKTGKRFVVTYGKQEFGNLSYAQAAQEFGLCVMHALTCEGKMPDGVTRKPF